MTRVRVPFALLILAAGGLYWGVALPARRATALLEAELGRVEAEHEPLRRRLARGERRRAAEDAFRRAGAERQGAPVTSLRRSLLEAIEGARVSAVRLSVAPAAPPLAARARLSAEGTFPDLVSLSQRVVGLRTGLVPEQVRWASSGSALTVDIEGTTLSLRP
jgi:hypothetical protein